MERKWYNESNKREKTLYASFLQNRSHDRLIVLIPMTMRSPMFRKFGSYPQAIALLIVLKDRILQMLLASHLHVNVSTDFKVLYLGVMSVKIVSWKYYVSYNCSRIFLNIGIISNCNATFTPKLRLV